MFTGGIPIGRLFGVQIKLHPSWFIIFGLVTWALSALYFPSVFPEWDQLTYWGIGVATSLLFFTSVLVHELAHSIVAQREGIPVRGITLFIFGGVSQITREPQSPGLEFRVGLAGPLTSLVIGGIFWGLWFGVRNISSPLAGLSFWLGLINVALAAFNLIPGFPLDGGRVFRSIIWWRLKDVKRATRIAAGFGRGIGFLFIFGGLLLLFQGALLSGIWIAFIGWFLQNAAASSYEQLAIQDVLRGHQVSEVMSQECVRVPARISVEELVQEHILTSGRRCFPVADNGNVLGLITMQEVKKIPAEERSRTRVTEAMVPYEKLRWVPPEEDLSEVLQTMTTEDINQMPVLKDRSIVGLVGRDNLLNFIRTRSELGK
ncbi:MAG: site-2 protease family protein [Dehalococcoidia bacterium]|nr:site-2 protease family protein [Dehalococcoidia bacterium]